MAIGGNSSKPEVSAQIMEKLRKMTQLTSLDFDNSFHFDWPSFNNHLLREPITLINLVRLRLSDDSRGYNNNALELRKLNSRMLQVDEKSDLQIAVITTVTTDVASIKFVNGIDNFRTDEFGNFTRLAKPTMFGSWMFFEFFVVPR